MVSITIFALSSLAISSPSPQGNNQFPNAAPEPPIRVCVDVHADPFPGGNKLSIYNQWINNTNWVLDAHGAKISWGMVGEFGEFILEGGAAGSGAELIRRVYASGRQVNAHSHTEVRAGVHTWPQVPNPDYS